MFLLLVEPSPKNSSKGFFIHQPKALYTLVVIMWFCNLVSRTALFCGFPQLEELPWEEKSRNSFCVAVATAILVPLAYFRCMSVCCFL